MKKKLFISVVSISVIIGLMLSFTACTKPMALEQGDFTTVINRQLPDLKINEDGNFDVLILTDTHFLGYGKNDTKTLNAIDKAIAGNEYELVVITGDMLEGYNNKSKYNKTNAIESVASMFEKNEQYWAVVAGNNDGEYCGDKKSIFSKLAKYEHCLVSDSDVGGVGNYTINIVNGDNTKLHTMIFMDSGMRGENKQLIPIENGQIEWYKTIAQNCKTDDIQTSMFMHIPFLDYIDAYDNGEIVTSYNNHLSTKKIDCREENSKLYNAMAECGNNKLLATGRHTHGQDYARYHKDMLWLQVRASGYGVWNDNLPQGGAKITYNFTKTNTKEKYQITNVNFEK